MDKSQCGVASFDVSNAGINRLRDRWQAASDMGGTAIPGQHWVLIDLGRIVVGAHTAVSPKDTAFDMKNFVL